MDVGLGSFRLVYISANHGVRLSNQQMRELLRFSVGKWGIWEHFQNFVNNLHIEPLKQTWQDIPSYCLAAKEIIK